MTSEELVELSNLLFKEELKERAYYEALYPYRELDKKAVVTRLAPSPTGFIHLGNLYSALADYYIAKQSNGIFYLRIEDTDQKRKVDGAEELIINALSYFDIEFDEGAGISDAPYGPYVQTKRKEIYHTYAKYLVEKGLAYPCFCTEEELAKIRQYQEENKLLTGYYKEFAKDRNLSLEEIKENLKMGKEYVLRLKSPGDENKEIKFVDEIKGSVSLPENIHDVVLLKKDGIPTYHFAHAVDDHLMRTTLVLRGTEWLASLPTHLQLFEVLGFKPPKYAHTAHMMKIDENTKGKRKLSKRSDKEMSLSFYEEAGYHPHCIKVYLLTLLNSKFEEWHKNNPEKKIEEFPFSVKNMNNSGALFDVAKLENICKNEFSSLQVVEVYDHLSRWAHKYEPEKKKIWFYDEAKITDIIMLYMGVGQKRRRKDLINAKQAFEQFSIFFNELREESEPFNLEKSDVKLILEEYLKTFDYNDDNQKWFDKIGVIAKNLGFATDKKEYKENKEKYKGDVSSVATAIRIAITGRTNTPDLWSIIQILGLKEMEERIRTVIESL